ncbi:MAG: L,D-transpeptidase [candidate division KSB1 bacterium]|nr:L,D-transpeptidase [candidate division KSB1 bacterium]
MFENAEIGPLSEQGLPPALVPKRGTAHWIFTACLGLLLGAVVLFVSPVAESTLELLTMRVRPKQTSAASGSSVKAQQRQLQRSVTELRRRFKQLTPSGHYLIVDTANNRIFVKAGDRLVHEGICSTGSYVMLRAGDQRTWVFRTPRGMFRVHSKLEAPVWRKPDWAFIEEGREPPPPMHPDRFEFGVLGEYALAFGDGYLVHGTLYKRLLGMPVTHGCVRLGDEDLRVVYHKLQEGSRIFVY